MPTTPAPHPVFPISDPWLLEYVQKGRGTHIVSAQRYDYVDAAGGHDYVDPDSGEILTHKAPRGVLRGFNRLHAEALGRAAAGSR